MASRAVPIVLIAQLVKLVLSTGTQMLIARLLLPEGRGVYGITISISTLLLTASFLGNEYGIRYLLLQKRIAQSQAFKYLILTTAISMTLSILSIGVINLEGAWFDGRVSQVQLILAIIMSFSQLITTQLNVFLTMDRLYVEAAVVTIGEEIVKLIAMLSLMLMAPTVETALVSLIIGNIIISSFCVVRHNLYKSEKNGVNLKEILFIYGYGARAVWLNLSNLSNSNLGTLILSGLVSTERVGLYNLAFGLVARIQVLPDALNRVLVPASIASKNDGDRLRMTRISVTGLFVFSIVVLPLFGLLNKIIMVFLFGREYEDAGFIAFVLLAGFSFKVIGKPLEAYFNEIVGNPTIIATIQIFNMIIMASSTYYGAIHYGVMGAAVGSAIAIFIGAMALASAYLRYTHQKVRSLLDFSELLQALRH